MTTIVLELLGLAAAAAMLVAAVVLVTSAITGLAIKIESSSRVRRAILFWSAYRIGGGADPFRELGGVFLTGRQNETHIRKARPAFALSLTLIATITCQKLAANVTPRPASRKPPN